MLRYVVKHRLMVTPEEVVVGYGELPHSERKSQRVFNGRITESVVQWAGFRGTGKVGGAKDGHGSALLQGCSSPDSI